MNINFTIPEPVFWVGGTIAVLLVLKIVSNLLYPSN